MFRRLVLVPALQAGLVFLALVTWASARRTRSNPGYQIPGFQPEDRPPGELKALRPDLFCGLKARNLIARGEAPGNLSPFIRRRPVREAPGETDGGMIVDLGNQWW
jgi:hypothetical protein